MVSFNSLPRTTLLGVLTWFTHSALCQSPKPTASVTNGTVVGVELPTFNQEFFGGIPFAQPPVGDLRLRLPVSINSTFPNGTFDASEYSPICPGHGGDDVGYVLSYTSSSVDATNNLPSRYSLDEDCLTLNVVRPMNISAGANLPVMLWIYGTGVFSPHTPDSNPYASLQGGGYVMGSSRDTRYNQSYTVNRSVEMGMPVIGVSINYRVSHFGFMNSRQIFDEGLSNIGLWDQRLALTWVQENVNHISFACAPFLPTDDLHSQIASFGGDPTKVTVSTLFHR